MSAKKQLLDPLGTLCKLIALNFNDINTKISIQNHVLTLQEPTGYQFLVRMVNGDGRENISELYYAIIRIIKWYLLPQYKKIESEQNNEMLVQLIDLPVQILDEHIHGSNAEEIAHSDVLIKLIRYMCNGFRKLQKTYEYGNVMLALQFYINLLEDGIKGIYDDSKLPSYILEKDNEFQNLLDYDKLKNFWDVKKLKRICELYDNCFKLKTDIETPETTKRALINGYLESIHAMLEITDREFQDLIMNSNKG